MNDKELTSSAGFINDGLAAAGFTDKASKAWMFEKGERRHLAAAFLGEFGGRRLGLPENLGGQISLAGSLLLDK